MAKEEEKVQSGGSSGGSSSGSSGGSSGGIAGSISKGSSSGGSKSSKVSSGSSVSRPSGKSFEGKGSSISNKPVSKAGQNVRAALQFGRSRTGSSQASSTAASPLTHYSRQGNAPSAYDPNVAAQERLGLRDSIQNEEAAAVANEANHLAEASGGKYINEDDTFYGRASAETANNLINEWNKGKAVVAIVEDGKVVVKNEDDLARKHYWVDVDADGNDIATQSPERQAKNNELLDQDTQAWLGLYNSNNYTKADVIRESAKIKQWINGLDDGTWVPPIEKLDDGTSIRDYLNGLYNLRDEMLENADRRDAAQILNDLSFKQQDLFNGLQQGASIPASVYKQGMDEIAAYAKQYSGYEDISNLFTDMQTWYANAYNRAEVRELKGQLEGLNDAVTKTQSAAATAEQNINWYQFGGDSGDGITLDDLKARQAEADAAFSQAKLDLDSTNARIAQLDEEYRSQNMTPEVEEALGRLNLRKGERDRIYTQMMREINANVTDPSQIVTQDILRERDQKIADDWNRGLNLNPQYYNLQDRILGVGKSWANRTIEAGMNLGAITLRGLDYAKGLDNVDQEALLAQGYATDSNMLTDDIMAPTNEYAAQYNANNGNGGRLTTAAKSIEDAADKIGVAAQEELAKAKEGASKWGKFGIDLASTALDVGFDALTGGGLVTMFGRVLGSGVGEARRTGATAGQQFRYGLSHAAIETITEKLTDGLGFVYGKSLTGDLVEDVISKLSKSDAGANLLRLIAGAVGEGGEEVLSDLLDPFTKWIIDENAKDNRTYSIDPGELLYDFLLGGAMGLLGQGFEWRIGGYQAKNIAQTDAMTERYDTLMEELGNNPRQVTSAEQREIKRLEARMDDRSGRNFKGAIRVNPNGSVSPVSGPRDAQKGKNRHATATNVLAEGFENEGYVNSTNEDEDYRKATPGMENRPLSEEEANEQSRIQSQEEEGKRQAAEEAGRKVEEQMAIAESQSQALEAQNQNVAPAPASQEQQNQILAASQAQTIEGQDTNPVQASKNTEVATATETAQGEAQASTQAQTPDNTQESVKLEGNVQGEGSRAVATAEQGKVAIESGETNNKTVAEVIPMVDKHISEQDAVSDIPENVFADSPNYSKKTKLSDRVASWFKNRFPSGSVKASAVGSPVIIAKRGIKNDVAHGLSDAKVATFAAIPDILDKGMVVSQSDGSVKDKSVTVAGKVMLYGEPVNVYCVVKKNSGNNRFYLHEVSDGNGTVYYQIDNSNKKNATPALQDSTGANPASADVTSEASIAQPAQTGNTASTNTTESGTITSKEVERGPDNKQVDKLIAEDKSNDGINAKRTKALSKLGYYTVQPVARNNGDLITYYVLDGDNVYEITEKGLEKTGFASAKDFWNSGEIRRNTETYQPGEYLKNGQAIKALMNRISREIAEKDAAYHKKTNDYNQRLSNALGKYQNGSGELFEIKPSKGLWFDIFDDSGNLLKTLNLPNTEQYIKDNGLTKITESNAINNSYTTGDEANDSIESGSLPEGNTGTVGRTGEGSESRASSRLQEVLEDSRGDAATHTDLRTANAPVLKKEDAQPEVQSLADWSEEQAGEECRLHNASGFPNANAGSSYAKGEGISAAAIHPGTRRTENGIVGGAGTTIVHETVHKKVQQLGIKAADVLNNAYQKIKATEEQINKTYSMVCWAYGRYYAQGHGALSEVTTEQWNNMSPAERKAAIDALPENVRDIVNDEIAEETLCFFISRDAQLGKYEGTYTIAEASREAAVEASLFSANAFDNIDSKMQMANLVSLMQAQNAAQTQQQPQKKTGVTPGKEKATQSAAERQMATKGEGATTDAAIGEATYISRTNAARSETADHLTDTQEKADAQTQRLLEDGYTWTDDDVVIAQKLMFDMIKSIRDYQMHRAGKMNTAAFRTLTEQYNKLMTKHQQMLSEAGQKLQANYMFSDGDKIIMKAAQTFLGFTKDGRFAGAAPNAKNAKIYAGIEEAVKRISTAIETGDSQGLAKICKDISNIRNVKKMFGPLGKFADEMETRVLDKVSKGENAAENLEKLAYGNLNAVCDDVQPYKALNAAKTIRVMNMLSNTATIVNNLANNFAQGAVSRSMVNQAFNQLAAKPFEALTGQKVLSTTQRGKTAQKAVHNAKVEALEAATLMQMYGISENNGRLELNDRGMFNPNINAFEQTMSLYKFLTGMGVEATDQMQAAGFLKEMELGIDADIKAGKAAPHTREQRMQEARHEVNRLLYKDDNATTALVQHFRDFLNKFSVGNEKTGKIGLGDITMAFAKIPANVVRARLAMTPEGALLQLAQYAKGVNKAKRMHAEVLANNIAQKYSPEMEKYRNTLNALYEAEPSQERTKAIKAVKSKISAINNQMWAEAREQCRGSVFRNLETIRNNYNENMPYDEAVERAGYTNAKEMSQFEAAQLSRKIGRAATSAGMMALGSVLRSLGGLRDFDQEPDDELRKMNKDKGYQGLMFNANAMFRPGHEWKDGDLVLDGEFLEVVAMPLTIGATAAEAAATAKDAKTWAWLKSMAGNGIAKTFEAVGDIPGMADAINMYESMTSAYTTDYDEKVSRLGAGLLNYAANTVPSFFMPNSVSQAAAGFDNTVRDVYTTDTPWEQARNIFMNKFPVLRNKIPASVDVWGNERNYGEGLWGAVNKMLLPGDVRVYRKNKYETEIERLVKEGYGNATPKTTVNSSFEIGDEKYTMTAQEKRDFKLGRNQQQRELYEAFMDSDYYDQLNDAERMKVFKSLKTSAERDAKQTMLNDRQLDVQVTRDRWETELTDVNDQIQFLAAKQMANDVLDRDEADMDYKAVDDYLTGTYKNLDDIQRELLNSTYSRLDDMYEAKTKYGIGSEMYQKGYDIYSDYNSQEGKDRVEGGYKGWEATQMWTDIANKTGASEKQMKFFEDNMKLYNHIAADSEKYHVLVDDGWNRNASQGLVKTIADLQPTNGRKTVSYKQRLTAIAGATGASDKQKWEAFFEYCPSSYTSVIRTMSRYRDKGYSYERALKAAGKWDK